MPSQPPPARARFTRGLLAERIALVHGVMIPYQWEALNDRIPGAEPSGCIQNLRIAAGEAEGSFHGFWFQDSDLWKWLEAASFRLGAAPDPELDRTVDGVIALAGRAQQPDGYLNTWGQLEGRDLRFANLRDFHELYCAGHLIEAGVAHHNATGKTSLLGICRRVADMLDRTFGPGPGQMKGYPGHEELELALVKLARATGEPRYARLAAWYVRQRGTKPLYFEEEERRRGEKERPYYAHFDALAYWQADRPLTELTEPQGHSVRAMYLYSAMADLAVEFEDEALARACRTLWASLVRRHLYVTGGIGADGSGGEKFSEGLDLPNDRAYAETCASVGLVFFARRMLELELRADYGDVMERALYNNVLAGMGADGRRFYYVNPLEVKPVLARRRYDCKFVKPSRVGWFACACCPPNVARLLASAGLHAYGARLGGLAVHLYAEGEAAFDGGGTPARIEIRTDYPWDGRIVLCVRETGAAPWPLWLRIPGWCRGATAAVNGGQVPVAAGGSYLEIRRAWKAGDTVELSLPMPVERLRADPRVAADSGCVALQRGPVVYCLEEADNGPDLCALSLPARAPLEARFDPGLVGGCVAISGTGLRSAPGDSLYSTQPHASKEVALRAIPYALWANRGEGEMRVWIRES
jgi:uncharacterized protein